MTNSCAICTGPASVIKINFNSMYKFHLPNLACEIYEIHNEQLIYKLSSCYSI